MSDKTIKFPTPADPNIEQVLNSFLEDRRREIKPSTMRKYEDIISLFKDSMNGYGHQYLDKNEAALFEKFYNADGGNHKEFCQIFGPDKIAGNINEFLDYFMVRKVMCGKEMKKAAGTVIKKLCKWLQKKGYVNQERGVTMTSQAAEAARDLPASEELAEMLEDYIQWNPVDSDEMIEDHFFVEKTKPGELCLSGFTENIKAAISLPRKITDACRKGWTISGAIGKTKNGWKFLEVWNVYP